jgi:hypothetical protein
MSFSFNPYKKTGYVFDKVFIWFFSLDKTHHMEDTENCTIPYHKKHVLFTEFTLNLHDLTIEFTRFCHKIYMLYSQNLQDFDTEFII